MPRLLPLCLAFVFVLASLPAEAAPKNQGKPKTKITVTKRYTGTPGYGFLPGYEPPQRRRDRVIDYTYPWYGWPGFYRGRWNHGGFGPCWTKTPIGPIWNCG
jgi:hypothetical protein